AQPCDEFDQSDRRMEFGMARRAHAFFAPRDPAGARDLRIDLGRRQDAAQTGFRALAQFHRYAFDLIDGGVFGELLRVESAVGGTRAELPRADLPHQVTVMTQMIRREAAFAGVVCEASELCASV